MPWPNAQQFREDHDELVTLRYKYKEYFDLLIKTDPHRMTNTTNGAQDIGFALDRLIWIHTDFENEISNRQPLTRGQTENGPNTI